MRKIIEFASRAYPERLRNIKNPPLRLYVERNIEILNEIGIAVIGSRTNTQYGEKMCKKFNCEFDDAGSIGKRYRRQDEIGTPWCITYDFDTEETGNVTVRNRDTMDQITMHMDEVIPYIESQLDF